LKINNIIKLNGNENLLKVYDVVWEKEKDRALIIMEKCEKGDLFDFMVDEKKM
jgi:serine/threonine protein kinase